MGTRGLSFLGGFWTSGAVVLWLLGCLEVCCIPGIRLRFWAHAGLGDEGSGSQALGLRLWLRV